MRSRKSTNDAAESVPRESPLASSGERSELMTSDGAEVQMGTDLHGLTHPSRAHPLDGWRTVWMRLLARLRSYLRAMRSGGRQSSTAAYPTRGAGMSTIGWNADIGRMEVVAVESFETILRATIERDRPSGSVVRANLLCLGEAIPLAAEVGYELTSVVSHGLRNAFKHADAASIDLLLDYSHGNLEITIRDDGKGFDPLALSEGSRQHWGLIAMQERVAALGGTCEVASTPGKGTSISIQVAGRLAYTRLLPARSKV
jgi:hypothetical protein